MSEKIQAAINFYLQGAKGAEVEKKFKIKSIYYHLKKRGIKARPKGTGRKISEEVKKIMSEQKKREKNPNYKKEPNEKQKEGLEKGRRRERTSKDIEIYREKRKQAWLKGTYENRINLGGRSKIFIIDGRMCKGKGEVLFVNKFKEKYPSILLKPKSINTPFGNYTPDFDLGDKYVELKSDWTYKVLLGEFNYLGDKTKGSINQLNKIKWISQNIKPVDIIILLKQDFLTETEYEKRRIIT